MTTDKEKNAQDNDDENDENAIPSTVSASASVSASGSGSGSGSESGRIGALEEDDDEKPLPTPTNPPVSSLLREEAPPLHAGEGVVADDKSDGDNTADNSDIEDPVAHHAQNGLNNNQCELSSAINQHQQQQQQYVKKTSHHRNSSMELRKLPVPSVLFSNNQSECTDLHDDDCFPILNNSNNRNNKDRAGSTKNNNHHTDRISACSSITDANNDNSNRGSSSSTKKQRKRSTTSSSFFSFAHFLRRTCLNSQFNLRTQMMLSFGLVSAFAILLVVFVCIAVSIMSGNEVNQITKQSFEDLIRSKEGATARYIAESLTLRILPTDLVQILYEATRDRFAGYPVYEDDSRVPIFDSISKSNRYPIRGPQLPLDWQMPNDGEGNVDEETQQEHVQHRWKWYQEGAPLSTKNAFYVVQGMCDPNVTTPGYSTYWHNCTAAHNDMDRGGAIAPTETNPQIYRKAADLAPLLKSLYEYYSEIKELGIYFANSGAGATVVFPHYRLNSSTSYESIGCNWLLEPHPYDRTRFVGSYEDFARCEGAEMTTIVSPDNDASRPPSSTTTATAKIHSDGQIVSSRLYNPMDRAWCRNQALHPDKIISTGPYKSAWQESEWLMSMGRAVYDRVTNEFIACISVDYVLDAVEQAVVENKVTANSAVTLVRIDDHGTVVASSAFNTSKSLRAVTVDELPVGLSLQSFASLKQLVDFDLRWDPDEVRAAFERFHVTRDGFLVSAYPIPSLPDTYDPAYRPEFFAISSVSQTDILEVIENAGESVDETVSGLVSLSLVVGLVGWAAVVLFIFLVSHAITLPLKYMNEVSSDIVNTFGSLKEEGIEVKHTTLESKCSPKTELSDVVKQFQKMVSRFSGSAMARSMQVGVNEIDNRLSFGGSFAALYYAREKNDFKYSYCAPANKAKSNSPEPIDNGGEATPRPLPQRVHFGSVINDGAKSDATTFQMSDIKLGSRTSLTSPLFFWIVALIVTPLLFTTVSISTFVTFSISQGLDQIIHETKSEYIWISNYALLVHAEMRAAYAAIAMRQAVRDNFLLTRYATWLHFGGLERTDSFTELVGGAEQCKTFSNVEDCPAYANYACDCDWDDWFKSGRDCENYETDSRYLQKTSFYCLAENAEHDGDRRTSPHNFSRSPEETRWWPDMNSVPGSEKGSAAAGHDTTYDRLRVGSAFPLFHTVYNAGHGGSFLSAALFYEADGLGIIYSGCSTDPLVMSRWSSTEANGASDLRPELCPLGKFGFDPRCRPWYHAGRQLAMENKTGLYVTPPYHFASFEEELYGQTATSPMIDPMTGEHVGQTLVDFLSLAIFEALEKKNTPLTNGGFPIVITGMSDWSGADTVIGPDWSLALNSSTAVGDIILPRDPVCPGSDCERRASFEEIRHRMKQGDVDSSNFTRTAADGSHEIMHIAFAPVKASMLTPVNSSDFSRGVNVSDFLVYSLALIEPEKGVLDAVEAQVEKQIRIAILILALVILCSTAFVVYISNRITLSMTEPMIYLLQLIVHINRTNVDGTPPGSVEIDKSYGSREILNVVDTMETLYRIVQSANVAFYAGDIEKAYYVLADAARLFRRLENSKAEGVANNNLGNTMLVFYRTIEETGVDEVCGFDKKEVIRKGIRYYQRSIELGEKLYDHFYDEEGWSPVCLEFMQHLSNRYFNRAMFLLTVKNGHDNPGETEELGLRDLQISTDMDVEIVDQGTEVGWDVRGADNQFNVVLSRVRGHLLLLEMGYEDKWDIGELLDNAFDIVRNELNLENPASSPLFTDFCPAGRMQQVETELIRYKMFKGELDCAAKIAIRMLVEDSKTLQAAQLKAVEAVVTHAKSTLAASNQQKPSQLRALQGLEEYQEKLEHASTQRDIDCTCFYDDESSLPETLKKSMRKLMSDSEKLSEKLRNDQTELRLSSLRASTKGDVTMEVF